MFSSASCPYFGDGFRRFCQQERLNPSWVGGEISLASFEKTALI